jgi:hypothetical protein
MSEDESKDMRTEKSFGVVRGREQTMKLRLVGMPLQQFCINQLEDNRRQPIAFQKTVKSLRQAPRVQLP